MPNLTFFCELDSRALTDLFADPSVVETLTALSATVSLGLIDLSVERAQVVQKLNGAGVPVIAWQLLPQDQGYWYNMSNAAAASARYDAFRVWTAKHGLVWDGIGIDIEPDTREIQRALDDRWTFLPTVAWRIFKPDQLRRATEDYAALVARMRADGYRVDSYVLRFVEDERSVGSTLMRRVTGLVDVTVDREIAMLYTSWYGSRGAAVLWSYGANAQAIAVGSTGGGVKVAGIDKVTPLTWDELSRDLLLAKRLTDSIHIFSLEGCIRQSYLECLRTFDWSAGIEIPVAEAAKVDRLRAAARGILWALARPVHTLVGGLAIALVIRRILRGKR